MPRLRSFFLQSSHAAVLVELETLCKTQAGLYIAPRRCLASSSLPAPALHHHHSCPSRKEKNEWKEAVIIASQDSFDAGSVEPDRCCAVALRCDEVNHLKTG